MIKRLTQPVNYQDQYNKTESKSFALIENYIYFYHTKTLLLIPTYPEQIQESNSVSFSKVTPLSRSAPIYSYTSSGPRTFQVSLQLHRDMMNDVNITSQKYPDIVKRVQGINQTDYVDKLINQLEAIVLPKYSTSEKMVNPPMVAVKFGEDLFCKGVVTGSLSKDYSGPILSTNKYALVSVSFTLEEVDPYDAEYFTKYGGGASRGFSMDLARNEFAVGSSSSASTSVKL